MGALGLFRVAAIFLPVMRLATDAFSSSSTLSFEFRTFYLRLVSCSIYRYSCNDSGEAKSLEARARKYHQH